MTDTASAAPSEREKFEAWAQSLGLAHESNDPAAMWTWAAWQAARRTQPVSRIFVTATIGTPERSYQDGWNAAVDAMLSAQPAPPAVAPTYDQVIAAWNAQADEHNQWGELGEDEKIEWAVACAKAAPPAVVEPLEPVVTNVYGINERIQFRRGWRAAEAAHGIGIKKGDSHA